MQPFQHWFKSSTQRGHQETEARPRPAEMLKARVDRFQLAGPPARRLDAYAEIDCPAKGSWALISSWSEASLAPAGVTGGTAGIGSLLESFRFDSGDMLLRPGKRLSVKFSVPVSAELLGVIERDRKESVALNIRCSLSLAPVYDATPGSHHLGVPQQFGVLGDNGSTLGRVIAMSDWIAYLRQWQWHEVELFEMPFDVGRETATFRRAFELLRKAEDRLRLGDYMGTFQNCRQALESLAVDTAPDADIKVGYSRILTTQLGDGERAKRMNAVMLALNDLGHLGRHEQRPLEDLTRQDSIFILRATLSAVQYLAGR